MATIVSYQVTSKNNKNVFVKKRAFDHIVLVYYLVTMFITIQSIATTQTRSSPTVVLTLNIMVKCVLKKTLKCMNEFIHSYNVTRLRHETFVTTSIAATVPKINIE